MIENFFETVGVMCCFGACFMGGVAVTSLVMAVQWATEQTRQNRHKVQRADIIETIEQVFF